LLICYLPKKLRSFRKFIFFVDLLRCVFHGITIALVMQFSVGGQLQPVTHLSSGKPEHSASAKISKRLLGFEYLTKVARLLGLLGSGGWVIKTRHHIQPAIKPSFGSFSTSSTLSFAFQKFFSNQNRFKMFKLVRISCPVLSSE